MEPHRGPSRSRVPSTLCKCSALEVGAGTACAFAAVRPCGAERGGWGGLEETLGALGCVPRRSGGPLRRTSGGHRGGGRALRGFVLGSCQGGYAGVWGSLRAWAIWCGV